MTKFAREVKKMGDTGVSRIRPIRDNTKSKKHWPRQTDYADHMRELGFCRSAVWIPTDCRKELFEIAEEMRDEFFKKKGIDPAKRLEY